MPNVYRYSPDNLKQLIDNAIKNGIQAIILFPQTPQDKKMVDIFLTTKFSGGRHLRRINKI